MSRGSIMANLKIRFSVVAAGLILLALVLGVVGPHMARSASDQIQTGHLLLAAFVFVGLCGVVLYGILERALNPIVSLTDHFARMVVGDLNLRLPVDGPEEMQNMAVAFNEMMGELELQIRDVTEEKQAAERGRQYMVEQLEASQRFTALADSAPMGIVLADPELNIVYQNATSESGFVQVAQFLSWNAEVVVGRSLAHLFPDEEAAREVLSDPDRLPYEAGVTVGPYRLRFLVGPVYTSEGEYAGPMLMWETVDEQDRAEVETVREDLETDRVDLEAEPEGVEEETREVEATGSEGAVAFEAEVTPPAGLSRQKTAANGPDEKRLSRGTALVGRSVRLLSERLSTISSMVEALCSEGDSLRRNLEETRQRTQNAAYLTAERSEALWELVTEMSGLGERTRSSTVLAKRLRKDLGNVEKASSSITHLADSIEHMVVEARLEVSRSGDAGAGMKVVVDEIRKLGREAVRLNKDVAGKVERVHTEVEEVLALLEEDRHEVRAGGRVARRAENALERIERDLNDVDERTNLLAEMAVGQSEIGTHIEGQLEELTELINVTARVAREQSRIVREFLEGEGGGTGVAVQEEA